MTDKRRHPRYQANEHAYVFWTDELGNFWQERAAVIDISSGGMAVALKNRVAVRAQVGLRTAQGGVTMQACVRHVRQKGLLFLAGLELSTRELHRHE